MVLGSTPPFVSPGPRSRACPHRSMSTHLQEPPSWIPSLRYPTHSQITPICHCPAQNSQECPFSALCIFCPASKTVYAIPFPYLTSSELATVFCMTTMEAIHISTSVCGIYPWRPQAFSPCLRFSLSFQILGYVLPERYTDSPPTSPQISIASGYARYKLVPNALLACE